jgi:hypothetical protein
MRSLLARTACDLRRATVQSILQNDRHSTTLANRIAALEKADERRPVLLTLLLHAWQVYQLKYHPATDSTYPVQAGHKH